MILKNYDEVRVKIKNLKHYKKVKLKNNLMTTS